MAIYSWKKNIYNTTNVIIETLVQNVALFYSMQIVFRWDNISNKIDEFRCSHWHNYSQCLPYPDSTDKLFYHNKWPHGFRKLAIFIASLKSPLLLVTRGVCWDLTRFETIFAEDYDWSSWSQFSPAGSCWSIWIISRLKKLFWNH